MGGTTFPHKKIVNIDPSVKGSEQSRIHGHVCSYIPLCFDTSKRNLNAGRGLGGGYGGTQGSPKGDVIPQGGLGGDVVPPTPTSRFG
jgi:hypothetical protein